MSTKQFYKRINSAQERRWSKRTNRVVHIVIRAVGVEAVIESAKKGIPICTIDGRDALVGPYRDSTEHQERFRKCWTGWECQWTRIAKKNESILRRNYKQELRNTPGLLKDQVIS